MKKVITLVLLIICSAPVSAANVWRDCGIGHWIAGPTWNGYLAITTNLVWDLGLSATTSHYITPDVCAGPFWAAAKYIDRTYPILEQDTAKGSGEHLVAMLDILECKQDTHERLIGDIRRDFSKFVVRPEYSVMSNTEKAEIYYYIVATHAEAQCHAI